MPDKNTEKQLQKFVEGKEKKVEETQKENTENKQVGAELSEAPAPKFPNARSSDQVSLGNQVGWQKLPIGDLPTKGFFYPEGAEVAIRSATAGEIRHWSTLQEDDISALDDMLNYILERCVSFKTKDISSSWKDIKEVDRFYILLAIREYTFVKGENNLQVKTSESSTINVTKDMIDYVNFEDNIMRFYDQTKRCFVLKFKTGNEIETTIPNVGITNFLKNYVLRKKQQNEMFDQDFITFAPFVIKDWRGLNDDSYEKLVIDSNNWSISEISVITHIKDLFMETVNPIVRYVDEGGAELTAPLNFQGGIKSIFLISDPFGELV